MRLHTSKGLTTQLLFKIQRLLCPNQARKNLILNQMLRMERMRRAKRRPKLKLSSLNSVSRRSRRSKWMIIRQLQLFLRPQLQLRVKFRKRNKLSFCQKASGRLSQEQTFLKTISSILPTLLTASLIQSTLFTMRKF